jgi:hypothetical protein
MTRVFALTLLVALAACDRTPAAGSADDKSAQGDSVRRAVGTVDAATAEADTSAAPAAEAAPAKP